MNKKYHIGFIILMIAILGAMFYWFQLRSTLVKHDCSWVKHTNEAIPAKLAMSEKELKTAGLLNCGYKSIFDTEDGYKAFCAKRNDLIIEEYKTDRPAVPAKDWWEPATPKQYEFCLHDKGL